MPTTRSQAAGGSSKPAPAPSKPAKKPSQTKASTKKEDKSAEVSKQAVPPPTKRQKKGDEADEVANAKPEPAQDQKPAGSRSIAKIEKLLEAHGKLPLEDYGLPDPLSPSSANMLANLFNAMLTSARISHGLATKTVKLMLENDYHDLDTLKRSTWDERTVVLTEGGYTHYREKTSTQLGDLAEFLVSKLKGDLNTIPEEYGKNVKGVRKGLGEIKGMGNVGEDIFCDSAQAYWTFLAPFLDQRSVASVEKMGLVKDGDDVVKALWKEVGEDPVKMARLANAITHVRLEGKEKEFS